MVQAQHTLEGVGRSVAAVAAADPGLGDVVRRLQDAAMWLNDVGNDARRRVTAIRVADQAWAHPPDLFHQMLHLYTSTELAPFRWAASEVKGVGALMVHPFVSAAEAARIAGLAVTGHRDQAVDELRKAVRDEIATDVAAAKQAFRKGMTLADPMLVMTPEVLEIVRAGQAGDDASVQRLTQAFVDEWSEEAVDELAGAAIGIAGEGSEFAEGLGHVLDAGMVGGWLLPEGADPPRFTPESKDLAVPIRPGEEIGIDYETGMFVRYHLDDAGRVVAYDPGLPWYKLESSERDTLVESGVVNSHGRPVTDPDGGAPYGGYQVAMGSFR